MATNAGALTLINDLVEEVKAGETPLARKANTVTAAIGTALTIILGGTTAWIESGTNIPSWLPGLVFVVGMLATTFGVSKTKNGMTASVADKLHSELAARIDLNHIHEPINTREAVLLASSEAGEGLVGGTPILVQSEAKGKHRAAELRDEADALIDQHINQL
ncbi:holin [Rhodococcus phage ReqiPepy6]|uniref:Holin n=1 Tax=Rhodococcus phage ReqiPepy6 TaxID=691965 RepID=D4P7C2_9CAUD|nr:holin [Rhodococcus phage ReqiPepy6]ADD80902.1 holin [Rhodococcus phage ReqiPepy6]